MKWYLIVVLICISLIASDAEHLFIGLWALRMSTLEKCLFKWVIWLPGVQLCEFFIFLEIISLSEVSLANMFSHTVGTLCNLVLFSLAMQKLCIFMRSHLLIISFMTIALGDVSVRMLLRGMSEIFLPMFSSRTFMVLRLIFKSFIHLEFIFVYGVVIL